VQSYRFQNKEYGPALVFVANIMNNKANILLLFLILPGFLWAQDKKILPLMEDSLARLSREIRNSQSDSVRLSLTHNFSKTLKYTIGLPGSFSYPFDSLRNLSKLVSPDKKFRIYNWNLPMTDGSNRYFCFIQVPGKKNEAALTYELANHSDSIKDPEFAILGSNNWFGALYYRIIPVEQGNKTFYTLLGWDGFSPTVNRKLIEILSFDQKGFPKFGAKVFRDYLKGPRTRIIFRFSATASMLLRPDEQLVKSGQTTKKTRMIMCDRLVPLDPRLEGQTDFYVPASDIFDGFVLVNGYWKFIRNIEGRNH
jgi:hypothetical protein